MIKKRSAFMSLKLLTKSRCLVAHRI